jgi:hypothetical protein
MDRYRSYGEKDDRPKEVGDGAFIGVDEYNAAENIRPGNVQKAVNHDFSAQDANTRGGFVCLPELGAQRLSGAWQHPSSLPAGLNKGIAYGNNRFVAVGDNGSPTFTAQVMYSEDGITWTTVNVSGVGPTSINEVVYGNGRFVACGTGGTTAFIYSTDGITWTASATNTSTYPNFNLLTYGAGRFVSTTTSPSIPFGSYTAVSTDNGVNWTITGQPVTTIFANAIIYVNGTFVSPITTAGYIGKSSDGITWTTQLVGGTGYQWSAVAYGNGVFSLIGSTSAPKAVTATSQDLSNWSVQEFTTPVYTNVTFHCGVFVAYSTTRLGTSIDGSVYLDSYSAQVLFAGKEVSGIACSESDRFVVSLNTEGSSIAYSDSVASVIFASGIYSDPLEKDRPWIMAVATDRVGFYAFGKASKTVSLGSYRVTEQSTIVQANNYVYLFRGEDDTPLRWDGSWDNDFELVPNTTLPSSFSSIPNSNQATFYQNRLWVRDGKDSIAASDVLAFTDYDPQANEFNLNTGNSDYIVTTFPFGTNSLVVFKNKSILVLNNVEGSLLDVTSTEVTRQVGAIGINAVTSIGPDLAYVSYGNINLLTLTSTNNALQHKTLPLSARIRKIMNRVNWEVGYKISLGYWSNKLYVALPLDNSQFCNAVVVYNFITEQWFGEWNFSPDLNMCIQGWQVTDYLGLQRLHAITEDGRIFVTDEGQNDISGTTVSEISTELLTRAYALEEGNHFQRRIYLDVATNRPKFSCASYTEGASEESVVITDQTYSRADSWKWADSAYDLTNANDDYNRAYRKDYSTGPNSVQTGSGFEPEMTQELRLPLLVRRQGRLSWIKVTNTQGFISVMSVGFETRPGQRANLVQV